MTNLFPISLEEIATLKGASEFAIREYLSEHHAHLTPSDIEIVLRLTTLPPPSAHIEAPPSSSSTSRGYVVDPKRNRFILAANYAGASQYQLAEAFGVTRQTIYSILRVHKERDSRLTRADRRYLPSQIIAMRDWYFASTTDPNMPLKELITQLISVADESTPDLLQ